jgi:hypothetical protein
MVFVGSSVVNMLYKSMQILLNSFSAAVFRSWLIYLVIKVSCLWNSNLASMVLLGSQEL